MSPPRGDAGGRREAVLQAALALFGQYGYRRTSMDDIAREAGIAKGSVYLSFTSKDEVYRALSARLIQQMLAAAQAAAGQPGWAGERLVAMLDAWYGTYAETVLGSPHARELLDAKHRLSADLVAQSVSQYRQLLRDVIAEAASAGQLDLESAAVTAETAADLLIGAGRGLEAEAAGPAVYRRRLQAMARILVAGLRAGPSAPAGTPGQPPPGTRH